MIEINAKSFEQILNKENVHPRNLQQIVVNALDKADKKVATAESCTGGLISKRITDISGAGEVFECGICSYANSIKNKLLGVKQQTLDSVGAVSPETAEQMANGVMELANSDFGVATTGIAGPTGAVDGKPVGLVYIAVCSRVRTIIIKALLNDAKNPSRETIRNLASDIALYFLLGEIIK